ncbi:MAG: FAD-dependent oxidoreductase [Pseudomonadota bacterium]
MAKQLPTQARVVIVGGGIIGCSTAYHLTKLGWKDVILLERKVLTCGTTWAAAGLVAQLRATSALSKMAVYGTQLYARLEAETEQATGYRTLGSILCARTEDREHEYRRGLAMGKSFGIEMAEISFDEARRMFPLLRTDDLRAVFWCPNDGATNPVDTTQALAKGARMGGARVFEGVKVSGVIVKNGAVAGVRTDQGDVTSEYVVNCAGMWGREVGLMAGVDLPLHAAEHMHIITKPIEGVYSGMPTMRDMDGYIYFREEVGGLLMGGFEPRAKPWGVKGVPEDFQFTELNEDWDQFEVFIKEGIKRVPALETAEIRHLTVVPESFTPDGVYMLGEAPGLRNFFVACGLNSLGIASAGGAGRALAEWMVNGAPTEDLWEVDVRRCQGWRNNKRYLRDRVVETVGLLYADHWPFRSPVTARPVRTSVLHDRLAARGACFGEAFGWERANWFAPAGVKPEYQYGWGRQNWFEYSALEHRAVREAAGLYDLGSMAKFLLQGPDAEKVLQYLCADNVAAPVGRTVYTPMLNRRGGIEADLTATRLAPDQYFIVTAGATEVRDFDRIQRHIPPDARAYLTNVTSAYVMLGLMGPKSREILAKLTDDDVSDAAFPYSSARWIDLAYARPLAVRLSYVGELGWELYIPVDFAAGVFDALMAEGGPLGLRPTGLHAVDSLRLEAGRRHWGSDISPDDTPLEAGLGFAVDWNKGDFLGREALLPFKGKTPTRRLVMFTLDDPEPLLYHDEPIYRDGALCGRNTHGAYAHFLGRAMGMTYLENPAGVTGDWVRSGRYEVDVEGRLVPARVHLKSPYDPDGRRVRM